MEFGILIYGFMPKNPHDPDALADDVVGAIANRPELADGSKRRILAVNEQRCFGFT